MSLFDSNDMQFNVIDLAILRLETVSDRAAQYMDSNMMDFAIREIEDPLKSIATQRGVSQRFIDAIHIIKFGFMKIALKIDHIPGPNGMPLNKLLEFGWDGPYEINFNPIGHWTGGKYGPGDHFAASVTHPGFIGYNIIRSLENWGFIEIFASKLIKDTTEYLRSTAFQ